MRIVSRECVYDCLIIYCKVISKSLPSPTAHEHIKMYVHMYVKKIN